MAAPQRSPHTPSTGIPSGRSSKHLSLLPTPRRPSFSTPAPTSPPSLSGFRAFRSLLPFGPNKSSTPVSSSVGPNPNGSRFASFSSVRKSISKDRNASLSSPMLPVMVIDRSADDSAEFPTRKSVSLYGDKPLPDQSVSPPKSSSQLPAVNLPSSSSSEDPRRAPPGSPTVTFTYEDTTAPPTAVFIPPVRTPSPLPAELSTIIEADTSGISKHLPSASPSPSPSPISPNQPILQEENSAADETSALDLSTTHLTSQVVDAMMAQEYGATKAWLDAAEEQNRLANASSDHVDVSFNLSSLDPDLAALLSPNRMAPSESNNTIKAKSSTDLLLSPPSSPHQPLHQSSRPRLRPIQRPSTSPTEGTRSVSVSSSAHSRTARRAPPSPLSTSHPPSPTLSSAIPASPLSSSIPAPTSSTPASMRRPQHSSSASSSTQTTTRRPLLGRMLQSDNWEGASSSSRTGLTRPSLDSAGYRPSSVASTSRTSLDTSRHRPSLDSNRHNSSANSTNNNTVRERPRNTPSPTWNAKLRRPRKRSMSVDEPRASPPGYTSPPSSSMSGRPEWLGPRTAKAFKAAGLLGSSDSVDGDDHASPPPRSKFGFGSMRSSSTVGRSTTDSRLGMVSPGGLSARRRGSGSGSYFGGGSQLMESPTLTMSSRDTPRSVSTAPTSVSGASWGGRSGRRCGS
ncbi:hypothetical protein C8J57DRAFT_21725 [Mycena rebaudengoi]|nr:hypothetical protein C8J57DRAFT_21725 [Mycena rebaudengoi]